MFCVILGKKPQLLT